MTGKEYHTVNFYKPKHNYHTQTNNIIESMVPNLINEYMKTKVLDSFLETCGISAIANALCMAGWREQLELKTRTGKIITIETQVLQELAKVKAKFPNRQPQPYVDAVHNLFGVNAKIRWDLIIQDYLKEGFAVMVCLQKPAPLHWIAVGAWKDLGMTQQYGYWDSWPSNYYPKRLRGTPPTNRWLNNIEWKSNVQDFGILIPPFKGV